MEIIYDKINDVVINIPTKWDDITIKQYSELINYYMLYQDNPEDLNIDIAMASIVEILTGWSKSKFEDLGINTVIKIKSYLKFLEKDIKFDTTNINQQFKYNNFIIKVKDFNNLTFSEYADTQHFTEKNNISGIISKLIDIYEKPNYLKFKFKSRKLNLTTKEKILFVDNMPATQILNLFFFIKFTTNKLNKNLALYLEKMALRLNIKNVFRGIGVGLYILKSYPIMILRNLKKSEK